MYERRDSPSNSTAILMGSPDDKTGERQSNKPTAQPACSLIIVLNFEPKIAPSFQNMKKKQCTVWRQVPALLGWQTLATSRLGSCSHLRLLLVLSITHPAEVNSETPGSVGFCRRIPMPIQQQTPRNLMWHTAGARA
jgi:hypothetical protein